MVKKEEKIGDVLENNINGVIKSAKKEPITISTLIQKMAGKGFPLLAILVALPFCQPIQIPGFSVPFGILIMFIGLRIAFGRHLWWPQTILNKEISPKVLEAIAQKTQWVMNKLDPLIHKRITFLTDTQYMKIINGLVIACMGAFLAIPFPIPLSNIVASWSIILIGLGILGKDGLLIIIGYILALICVAFILFLVIASVHLIANSI